MDAAHQVIEFTSSFPNCRRYVFSTASNINPQKQDQLTTCYML